MGLKNDGCCKIRHQEQGYRNYALLAATIVSLCIGQTAQAADGVGSGAKKFAQLDQMLPTPNVYRTASGAPGNAYWQQQAD